MLRGVSYSAKWAADQLRGALPPRGGTAPFFVPASPQEEFGGDIGEYADFCYARSLFDCREYLACAHALSQSRAPAAIFLAAYATFLHIRRSDPLELASAPLPPGTEKETKSSVAAGGPTLGTVVEICTRARGDAFCEWLMGVVAALRGEVATAGGHYTAALTLMPLLWSAWADAAALAAHPDTPSPLPAPPVPAGLTFAGDLAQARTAALQLRHGDAVAVLSAHLAAATPRSAAVALDLAVASHEAGESQPAVALFARVADAEPHNLRGLDTLSNVMYVSGDTPALALLSQRVRATAPHSAVAAVVVGNFLSLRGLHAKACALFQRAASLDPGSAAARVLLGHELLELRNPRAAVDAYRAAVAAEPRDYRAWYALGNTYEILQLYAYAVYYYRRAAALRPSDSRMWCGMAQCFERIRRPADAVACYLKAEACGDREGVSAPCLAGLYAAAGVAHLAARYYRKHIIDTGYGALLPPGEGGGGGVGAGGGGEGVTLDDSPDTVVEALLFLAHRARALGDVAAAESLARLLLAVPGQPADDAAALLLSLGHPGARAG